MNWLLWLVLISLGLILATGLSFSFLMTRRSRLGEIHSPSEYGLDFEEVVFKASDGVDLRGVWLPAAESDRAVVILHGHGNSMDLDIQRAPFFHRAGFNVFLFDFRAHGRSAGRMATFGYLERQDVVGAVEFLKSRGVKRIGLLGFSYGGMASMLAAPICPEVNAVVSDGGPARVRTAITGRVVEAHLPRWLGKFLGWLTVAMTSLRFRVNLFHYEPIRWVGKIAPRPVFFVHGEKDKYLHDFDELYTAASEPKEAWRLPGVEHTKASEVYPEEFYRRVIEFFDRNL
jgi:pimeloyl-ACP methyl ester carboxylesterase